jgi:hypothetical protein
MSEPENVPIAEKLLKAKLFGFRIKRFLQAFAVPILPGVALLLLEPLITVPLLIRMGVFLGGVVTGVAVFWRTPRGQPPHRWFLAWLKVAFDETVYHWQPKQIERGNVEIDDDFHTVDRTHTRTREYPEDRYQGTTMFGRDKNTIDRLDFDVVHDNGIVELKDRYSKIIELEPRQWVILDDEQRAAVIEAYKEVLMGAQATFQSVTVPVPYDASRYLDELDQADRNRPPDETPLLSHGRAQHGRWLEDVVRMADIRDRRHFVVVSVEKSDPSAEDTNPLSILFGSDDESDLKPETLQKEVETRAQAMANSLPRTGVECEIIDDREEVLKILHYVYKGGEAPPTTDFGSITRPDPMDRTATMAAEDATCDTVKEAVAASTSTNGSDADTTTD